MFKTHIDDISVAGWNDLFIRFQDQNILQTWEYGKAKAEDSSWSVERVKFQRANEILGIAQIMIRTIPFLSRGLVWINRGPLWRYDGSDSSDLGEMLSLLHSHYAEKLGNYVLIAPPVYMSDEFAPILSNTGFKPTNTPGWASAKLDLSKPIEELRKGLNQKWRNCLNKAEHASYEVKSAHDGDVFDDFLEAHAKFHSSKKLETNLDADFFRRLRQISTGNCSLDAFVAYHDGLPIGSVLIASYGNTCEYVAGNSTDLGRQLNSGQLILWNVIVAMKRKGLAKFDLGGMDQELTPKGIFRFKKGVGGTPYRMVSEIEPKNIGVIAGLLRQRIDHVRSKSFNF